MLNTTLFNCIIFKALYIHTHIHIPLFFTFLQTCSGLFCVTVTPYKWLWCVALRWWMATATKDTRRTPPHVLYL